MPARCPPIPRHIGLFIPMGDIPMEAPPRSFGPLTIPMRPWLLKSPGRSSQQVMRRFNKLFPWHQVLGVITHPLSMSLLLDAGSCRSKAAQLQLPSLFGSLETDVPRDAQRDRSKDVNCFTGGDTVGDELVGVFSLFNEPHVVSSTFPLYVPR